MINHYTYIRNNKNDCNSMYKLPFVIGLNKDELPIYQDLCNIHNLLVVGRRLSGKTSFVNNILTELTSHLAFEKYQLIICTQNKLNYQQWSSSKNVVLDTEKAILKTIENINNEAKHREETFLQNGYTLPYIILVIDDLTEFISDFQEKDLFLDQLRKLTQTSKHLGIHLICTGIEQYKEKIPNDIFHLFTKRYFIDNPANNDINNFIPTEIVLKGIDIKDPDILFKTVKANKEPIIAQKLIEEGLDINKQDLYGNTPIVYAQTVQMAQCLFYNGADLDIINPDNINNKDVLRFIMEYSDN